jgi:hypothetical protein
VYLCANIANFGRQDNAIALICNFEKGILFLIFKLPKPPNAMLKQLAYCVLITVFLTLKTSAQLAISNLELLDELKATTTLVFMPASDTVKHQIYRELMEEHWKLTPMKFLSYSQYTEYKYKKGYSYMLFGDDFINDGTSFSSYVYFELWHWHADKDNWDKRRKVQLARMELYPDPETTFDPDLIYDYRYSTEGHIFNWSPGMFKNYMQLISRDISKGITRTAAKAETLVEELKLLKDQTLYIPEYTFEQHNSNQKSLGFTPAAEMMADYPYKYKVVKNDELSKMISESEGKIYYLLFVRSNSDKYLAVMEGHDGNIVYHRHTPQSINVKRSDIKKLAKVISEGK